MKRILSIVILARLPFILNGQIIADHTVVDKYDDIPQYYIDQVKKMMLVVAGESHSLGYMNGLVRLGSINPAYAVNYTYQGTPESYTSSHLRATRATWGDVNNTTGWMYSYGEEDWYKTSGAVTQTRAGITYCRDNNLEMSAFGFGWCYDGAETNMTDYLSATQSYIDHCRTNGYNTKVFFTTHAIDDWNARADETSYLKSLANIAIRDYVASGSDRILFDYADILCYDEGSEVPNTISWNGHTYPVITVANDIPDDLGHISATGQLRLAKAMWWMLARIAGWNGIRYTGINESSGDEFPGVLFKKQGNEIKITLHDADIFTTVYLYNLQGILVLRKAVGSDIISIDLSPFAQGLYFVALAGVKKRYVKRIVLF